MNNPIIKIELEDGRIIRAILYPEVAPITVENFLKLVEAHYFDGIIFHRVIKNFMIQTGGYKVDNHRLVEAPKCETIKGEFKSNGVDNDIHHKVGVLSMARTNIKDSASSQFFICVNACPHLDGEYAAFGKTIDDESLQVAMDISKVETMNIGYGFADFPANPITIETITREA